MHNYIPMPTTTTAKHIHKRCTLKRMSSVLCSFHFLFLNETIYTYKYNAHQRATTASGVCLCGGVTMSISN